MKPVIREYRENFIRLKVNQKLLKLAADKDEAITGATRQNMVDYAVTYGQFDYQAASWRAPHRVIFKIEKPANHMTHLFTFIVANMELEIHQVIAYYFNIYE